MYDAGMTGPLPAAVVAAARATAGLDLLVLFGSRARGAAWAGSDWDFGYLADETADVPALLVRLVEALDDERVDLVDLRRASGLLRYRAAGDGLPVHETAAGLFDRYRFRPERRRHRRRTGRTPRAVPQRRGSRLRVAGPETRPPGRRRGPCRPAAVSGLSEEPCPFPRLLTCSQPCRTLWRSREAPQALAEGGCGVATCNARLWRPVVSSVRFTR